MNMRVLRCYDTLKNGRLVRRAATEPKAEAILRIAIMLGVNLKMNVVAEGVETAEQLEFLRACGGSIVQGFHIARPMPYAACTQWLVNNIRESKNETVSV